MFEYPGGLGDVSLFDFPHSKPYGVNLYAVKEQLPGVKETVITIAFSPKFIL